MGNFFGDALRKAFDKVTGSASLGQKELDEFKKDIQRALITSDVNIKVVMEVSKEIEKKAQEKIPTGLSRKEFLVKSTYDVLVKTLNGTHSEPFELKPGKVLLVGLFGTGKCVHADSKVVLSSGESVRAEDLYERFRHFGEEKTEGGKIVNLPADELFVPSFNPFTLKVEKKPVTHLWKLEGKELLEVKLDNGNDFGVRVTPEHPFFVMREGRVEKVRADELKDEDFVAVPRSFEAEGKTVSLWQDLAKEDLIVGNPNKNVKEEILAKHGTLKEAHKALRHAKNYCKFTTLVREGQAPIELIQKKEELKVRQWGMDKEISFPATMTPDLAEFLGYVIGDGHLDRRSVEVVSEDPEVIARVPELFRKLFDLEPTIERDSRTRAMWRIRANSTTLVNLLSRLFSIGIGRKGKNLRVPSQIMVSKNEAVKRFLSAYFDCDSSAAEDQRSIELSSESKNLIQDTCTLLLRFGINSLVSRKSLKGINYWRLLINSRHAEAFAEKIGFGIARKQARADKYAGIGELQGARKQDLIPAGELLKKVRELHGFSIGEIQAKCNSYGQYEKHGVITRESLEKVTALYESGKKGMHYKFLKAIQENPSKLKEYFGRHVTNSLVSHYLREGYAVQDNGTLLLTGKAHAILEASEELSGVVLSHLKRLSSSNVSWLQVSEIKPTENEQGFVYDLTVKDNHSFIADNIIVHNTTTVGKLARLYQKKSLKVGVVGADVWRPAAFEQLKQYVSQLKGVSVYGEPGEKDPVKILRAGLAYMEKEKCDVVLVDSAGRSGLDEELAEEIKKIHALLKPDNTFLVLNADLGQSAGRQAEAFHNSVGVTGVILTKTDGSAKGGGAISACSITGAPVLFIGTGEKIDEFEVFDAQRYLSRVMGYGDLQSLLEKAQEVTEEEDFDAEEMMTKGLTLDLFYKQMKAARKMGPLGKVMEMMGVKQKMPDEVLKTGEDKLNTFQYVMDSMTKKERADADLIDKKRIARIANGSGTSEEAVRELLKSYKQTEKMFKMMQGGRMRGQLAKLSKMKGFDLNKLMGK